MRDHQVSRRAWLRLALAPALTLSSPLLGLAEPVDPSDHPARQQIPFRTAEVLSADGRSFVVTWSAPAAAGRVAVYARSTPDLDLSSGAGRRVGEAGPAGRLRVDDLPPAPRWYFELRPERGAPLVVADRSLHLRSAPNFRDVGGYRTLDGRWVRMGQAYRSDQLDRLSDADLAKIASLKPALVVDLRTDAERRSGPDRTPPSATPLVADVMASFQPDMAAVMRIKAPQDAIAFMTKANRQFVSGTSALTAYATLLDRLDGADGVVVYHCTAGKDRTGWASAVLLTMLGAPRENIMADYLASNAYLADKNKATLATLPPDRVAAFEPMLTVRPDYLEAAFAEVQTRYGSFDRYLSQGLGLDATALANLRSRFLVGAPIPQTPIRA
jgi:protein-tyrosine phosphatase